MSQSDSYISQYSLLSTKLHRPRIEQNFVPRPRLVEHLDQRRSRPLTLVTAPAGYGKTTLVSHWMEENDWPNAWLSLDVGDDDISQFLVYFLTAIQTIFPNACNETRSLLNATMIPPLDTLSNTLFGELHQIEEPYILVLDDYQNIQNIEVHDLLSELLTQPPLSMHLVLISRNDPPLNLIKYRARRQLSEIRIHDIRFTENETESFLEKEMGGQLDSKTLLTLFQRVEGWVTGMRMFCLSLKHRGTTEWMPSDLDGGVSYITDFFREEVIENQPPVIQDYLLKTAILDSFCAPLCQFLQSGSVEKLDSIEEVVTAEPEIDGASFLEWLTTSNLFIIRLDDQNRWFRFHHLFRETLQNMLIERFGPQEIAALHKLASYWLADDGLIEEALHHSLAAGDETWAAKLIAKNRHILMNQEKFHILERWIKRLPQKAIDENVELLLSQAWLLDLKAKHEEIPPILEQATVMLEQDPNLSDREKTDLFGEIALLRGIIYHWMGVGVKSLEDTQHAIEVTPREHKWVYGVALTFHAGAYQLVGQLEKAYEEIDRIIAGGYGLSKDFAHRAYDTLMAVEMLTGNPRGLEQAAHQQIELTETPGLFSSLGWARYGLGVVYYLRNELQKAEEEFKRLVELRYRTHALAVIHGYYGLALTYQAMGKSDTATEASNTARAWAKESENPFMLFEAHSFASHLALLQGQVPNPDRWAHLISDEVPLMLMLQIPHLTMVNVLLGQATPDALQRVRKLLELLRQSAESNHNTWRLMELKAMQAILLDIEGDNQSALVLLEEVLTWTEPRGYIRLLMDLGPRMAVLLGQLMEQGVTPGYIKKILNSFPDEKISIQTPVYQRPLWTMIKPLTNRELEVIELLAKNMSNKEIGDELVLSQGSVKQYTHRIYRKLNVKNRHQAVEIAFELGILPLKSQR
jgi:LuxR family maltose regulon positive regulatory protein